MEKIVIPEFTEKTVSEFEAMTDKEQSDYLLKKKEHSTALRQKEIQDAIEEAKKDFVAGNKEQEDRIKGLEEKQKTLIEELDYYALRMKAIGEGQSLGTTERSKSIREYLEENKDTLNLIKKEGKEGVQPSKALTFDMVVKGLEGATDIGGRDYFNQTIEAGIGKQPVRRTRIMDLFRRKPVGTEYLHYWEENVVTRNAKFVVACATSTHTTKVTWAKRTVELAKIRDIVDVCLDMLDDYTFVESELRDLIDTSIKLLADRELLLGTGVASTDMLSIETIASEFDPANVLAPYTAAFKAPTIGDLTAAMKAQIYTFGQENAWEADTVVMNYNDMIKYLHAKDANNNYLFPNFVYGATDIVNGMRIVTSPIVAPNTLYVFDSMKGVILDRKKVTISTSYENRDNIEHELVTFVGVERLQFHVRLIDRDAFMKTSDIAAALTAITAP